MGSAAFNLINLVETVEPDEIIVEVGAAQEHDAGSTYHLVSAARRLGCPCVSIDVDIEAVTRARDAGATAILGRGEDVLDEWEAPPWVRFCWADGWDWPYSWSPNNIYFPEQQARYRARGMEITQLASARSHLRIAQALDKITRAGALIVIDDTWASADSRWHGKGQEAVPWLLSRGEWQLTATDPIGQDEPENGFVALTRI